MERVEVQHIMETELKCVQRAAANVCDRNCGECDLLMDTNKIIQAYSYVITLLEVWDGLFKSYEELIDKQMELSSIGNHDPAMWTKQVDEWCIDTLRSIVGDYYADKLINGNK